MIHSDIRAAVLAALENSIPAGVSLLDGCPGFLEPEDLPAVAVYLTDAEPTHDYLDGDLWRAELHVEVILAGPAPDSELDEWMEEKILPLPGNDAALADIVETITTAGYDYQRDEEGSAWASVDMKYSITYSM